MAQRRAIISRNISRNWIWKKKFQSNLAKRFFDRAFITFYYNLRKPLCQPNKSREILACRRQVLSREQREGERQRARVDTRRASEGDRQRECVVEEEDKILAKKVVGKKKESGREEGEKIIVNRFTFCVSPFQYFNFHRKLKQTGYEEFTLIAGL